MLQTAARVAGRFNLDPVAVLATCDEFEFSVQIAAARVLADDEKKQNAAKGGGRPMSRPRRR